MMRIQSGSGYNPEPGRDASFESVVATNLKHILRRKPEENMNNVSDLYVTVRNVKDPIRM